MVCLCECVAVSVKGPSFLAEGSEHSCIHISLDITIPCLGGDNCGAIFPLLWLQGDLVTTSSRDVFTLLCLQCLWQSPGKGSLCGKVLG